MATAQEVRAWFEANPNITDKEAAMAMQQNGITPQLVSEALGRPLSEVQQRYDAALGPQYAAPQTGLIGSENALQGGLESALSAIASGYGQSRNDITSYSNQASDQIRQGNEQAQGYLSPYRDAGSNALTALEGLSGARGQQAFDSAYTESPYVKFLAEQGNRNVTNNASALGGLGGGNVQKELVRFGQGLAGQGLQQQVNNLQYLTGTGASAASNSAGLASGMGNALAGVSQNTGANLGNLATNAGNTAGNYAFQTGGAVSQGRTNAGNMLAGQIAQASTNMANLAQGQGQAVSNVLGDQGNNLAQILINAGLSQAQVQQIMAQNQAQNAQNTAANYGGNSPSYIPSNYTGQLGQAAGGIGTLLGAVG